MTLLKPLAAIALATTLLLGAAGARAEGQIRIADQFGIIYLLPSAFSAYAFARLRFPGRDRIFLSYLATLMVPWAVVMIPEFVLIKMIGWMDTHYALVVPALFSAYGTFMLRQPDGSRQVPLSACGMLNIYASTITQGGVLRAEALEVAQL